jgi:hypothetical protein
MSVNTCQTKGYDEKWRFGAAKKQSQSKPILGFSVVPEPAGQSRFFV